MIAGYKTYDFHCKIDCSPNKAYCLLEGVNLVFNFLLHTFLFKNIYIDVIQNLYFSLNYCIFSLFDVNDNLIKKKLNLKLAPPTV